MPTAMEVVETLKEAMAASPGITEIAVDGLRLKINVRDLDYWERRAAREAKPKTRPISTSVDLSGGV